MGSSPRLRVELRDDEDASDGLGIIPAFAGRTGFGAFEDGRAWDHPRVCG